MPVPVGHAVTPHLRKACCSIFTGRPPPEPGVRPDGAGQVVPPAHPLLGQRSPGEPLGRMLWTPRGRKEELPEPEPQGTFSHGSCRPAYHRGASSQLLPPTLLAHERGTQQDACLTRGHVEEGQLFLSRSRMLLACNYTEAELNSLLSSALKYGHLPCSVGIKRKL